MSGQHFLRYFPEYQSECCVRSFVHRRASPLLPHGVQSCHVPFLRDVSAPKYDPVERKYGAAERLPIGLYNLSRYPARLKRLATKLSLGDRTEGDAGEATSQM